MYKRQSLDCYPIEQDNTKTVHLATEAQAHGPGGSSSYGVLTIPRVVWQLRVEARLGPIVLTHAEPLISFRSRYWRIYFLGTLVGR